MNHSRRKFFQYAGAAAAGALILPNWGCKSDGTSSGAANATPANTGSIPQFGLQLWSVRDDMAKDPKGVLKQLASFGYKQIESFEGEQGMFWGMTNTEFRKYMDDLGMSAIASHCIISQNFEKKAEQAAEIGLRYLICPWMGPQKTMDDWKKIADNFNSLGETCKKYGLRFAYHNHAYSFYNTEGQTPQDFLMANTDPELVDFEMDIYWVATAGQSAVEYLQKYPNRFRLGHVKDRSKTVADDVADASCDLGTGALDYSKILKAAQDAGMQYFIVEQELWEGSTPMKSAQANAAYMSKLVFA